MNHYILGKVAWNPNVDLNLLINNFTKAQYGELWEPVVDSYELLENTIRHYGSIPFTKLKSSEEIERSLQRVHQELFELGELKRKLNDDVVTSNLSRLILMLNYAYLDLKIQKERAWGDADNEIIYEKVKKLVSFLEKNHNKGMFLLSDQDNLRRYINHYHLN